MDFNCFDNKWSNVNDLLPSQVINYELLKEIELSANLAKEKYGEYSILSDLKHHESYFHLIKTACDNKKMIIRNPLYVENNQPEIISSDIYFFTNTIHPSDLICNYYFEKEQIVLGIFLGTGRTGLSITVAYMIYLNSKQILTFFSDVCRQLTDVENSIAFPKIYNSIKNIDAAKINDEKPLIRMIYGFNIGLFHTCCTFLNGIYIMDKIGINNDIDELIMGPDDPFLIEKYFMNKYNNINIVHHNSIANLCGKIHKGICIIYSHYHVTNNCAEFIKSYVNTVMPIKEAYKDEIEYIKNNYFPIFSINLRCVTCQVKDTEVVISETINKLKQIYPKSYFLIGGFLGDYNEELLSKNNTKIATNDVSYPKLLHEYTRLFESIEQKVKHTDIKSLINLKINNVLEFTKIVNFSINTNTGYTVIETILQNIPSLYFGTKWIYHVRQTNFVSKQTYVEPIYIEEPNINFISDYIYAPVTCEITSDTIVNTILEYDANNGNKFTTHVCKILNLDV
jgi:hypothetical protein